MRSPQVVAGGARAESAAPRSARDPTSKCPRAAAPTAATARRRRDRRGRGLAESRREGALRRREFRATVFAKDMAVGAAPSAASALA